MNSTAAAAVGAMGCRPLFTASQWQELEHQALIFKYMMAGIPVPPDLLLPIRQSFEAMASRMYPHPSLGFCSFYGKKLDPEPGRCRRTDGKKWRCSKDAYPDSKYCERHMHRGRNRSRKPVESHALSQSQQKSTSPSSSTVTSLTPTTGGGSGVVNGTGGNGNGGGNFQSSIPLNNISGAHTHVSSGTSLTQLQMDSGCYSGIDNKGYRYAPELKSEVDSSVYLYGGADNVRGLGIDSSLDKSWGLMPSSISAFPPTKDRNESVLSGGYSQLHSLPDLGQESVSLLSKQQSVSLLSKQQPQHYIFSNSYVPSEVPKQECQSLRPFFDEWPKTRNSWSELDDEQSNRSSFSTTQLSISIPMASSDFSTTCSRSPNAD